MINAWAFADFFGGGSLPGCPHPRPTPMVEHHLAEQSSLGWWLAKTFEIAQIEFSPRRVQYMLSMMRKCGMIEVGGERIKNQNRGIYNYSEIRGICNKHNWLREWKSLFGQRFEQSRTQISPIIIITSWMWCRQAKFKSPWATPKYYFITTLFQTKLNIEKGTKWASMHLNRKKFFCSCKSGQPQWTGKLVSE